MSIWTGVDLLLDRVEDPTVLCAHGLQLLAARRWRQIGRPVPPLLLAEERAAAMAALVAPTILARIRASVDGPIILLKGAEVAARYPDPALRPSGDIDVLVQNAAQAERALRAAGCEPAEGERTAGRPQHRPPLRWPSSPLPIELHHALPGPSWIRAPRFDQLAKTAEPAAVGVDGILALPPAQHALVLAAHAWRHYGPSPRYRDLIDVALLAEEADAAEIAALAQAWGLRRVWTTTRRMVTALSAGTTPPSLIPARQTPLGLSLRERTVADVHLRRWLGTLWAPTAGAVPRALVTMVGQDLRPWPGESWPTKLGRLSRAGRDALLPVSAHRQRR
ncbi:MAG TPA: nucleotidyltransferase family protein [Thermomicrobiales bacterium]|nr:nucleotidyltransferase family protein [Thermomicrobiales bacterium]